jgi:hypothetical protein
VSLNRLCRFAGSVDFYPRAARYILYSLYPSPLQVSTSVIITKSEYSKIYFRYYKITDLPQGQRGRSLGHFLFQDSHTIQLIASWFFLSAILNLPLLLSHANGEDPAGFCGAKKFTSIYLLISYELTIIASFAVSVIITGVYYYRLGNWLKANQTTTNQDSIKLTQSLMRFMKIVTILPMFTASPTMILSAGQMIPPELPMWVNRLLVVPYFIPPCANPWLTIGLMRPFRKRFRELLICSKSNTVEQIGRSAYVRRTAIY